MLTLPAFSPAPKECDAYLPASPELAAAHRSPTGPYQIDSYTATKNITFTRNPAWDPASDPIRKAYVDKVVINETVSQDSIQQQLQTGTAERRHGVRHVPAAVAAAGPDRARRTRNLNLGETARRATRTSSSTPSRPTTTRRCRSRRSGRRCPTRINRDNIIQVLGGPKVNPPLTHVLPSNIVGGEENFDLVPATTRPRPSRCWPRPATPTA